MRSPAKWIEWWLVSAIGAAIGVPLGFLVAVVVYPLKRTCLFDIAQLCPSEWVNVNGTLFFIVQQNDFTVELWRNAAGALALSDEKKVWVLPPESLADLSEHPLTTVLTEAQFPARVNRVALSPDSSYLGFTTEKMM